MPRGLNLIRGNVMLKYVSFLFMALFLFSIAGCNIDLTEQGQKDRALAEKTNERLKTRKSVYGEIYKEITYDKASKGNYNFKFLKNDMTAQEVFDYTIKLLIITSDINDTVVMTGRSYLSLTGYMGSEKVVFGTYTGGGGILNPYKIELMGKYAGQQINENYTLKGLSGGGLKQ